MWKKAFLVLGGVAVLAASATDGSARPGDRYRAVVKDGWEELGCVFVSRRADRDVIRVGRQDGRFKAIRLSAVGNDVNVLDLKVVYGNGQPDDIPVRSEIREGTETRPLDLQGRERSIKQIEVVTKRDFQGRGRGRAKLCAYGLQHARAPEGPRGKWVELGCQNVGFISDRDVIRVGRRDGKFTAIRLDVSGNTVFFNDLKVVYGNGQPDDIPIRSEIRAGGHSRVIDLKGGDRFIDRIEMIYRSKPSFRGTARVCVSGLDR
ncbi:MAG: hypothetical protein AB7E80_00425 [Hyphomicrobiaceae bacterium]